jgi:AcrR family transcriptional regulator
MARIVKEEDYSARRNEILDVARQLVYTQGYEQMSIQDILDALKISKGAFYHYFDSKPALLEALIERMVDEAEQTISPILQDPNLSALEKIQRYFSTAVQWKTAQKDFLLALLHVWYSDDNAITRQKMVTKTLKRFTPSFTRVIQEGKLATSYPEDATEISLHVLNGLGDKFGEVILANETGTCDSNQDDRLHSMEKAVAAYTDALERILGAPTGSMQLMDTESIRLWID